MSEASTENLEYFSEGDRQYAVWLVRETALQTRIEALEAENATIRATYLETVALKDEAANLRVSALQVRITALEAALDEIRIIARSVLPSEEVISDHQAHWNGKELYQIAKKAESALKGEVKE